MKTAALTLAASILIVSASLSAFSHTEPELAPVMLTGKDKPILLARMIVTAAPLDNADAR